MHVLKIINLCLGVIFTLCYFYQFIYLFVAYFGKKEDLPDAPPHKFAIIISARNESKVIHNLLNSLNQQDYPKNFYKIFLVADNCTDNTAEIARNLGAIVYERFNTQEKGKGYAVDYLIKAIERDCEEENFDAYIVFDADNVAEKNYLTEINKTFAKGYDVVTSYRNASNYSANWRSAGQGMFFIRESRILNLARMRMKANNYVMGTGFLFSSALCKRNGGWPFHCLTEDGEFTMNNAITGVSSGYSNTAIFYDEQSTKAKDSWYQKLRWCKGGLQIFRKYLPQLAKGLFGGKFLSCFDMSVCLACAYIISMSAVTINAVGLSILLLSGADPFEILFTVLAMIGTAWFLLFIFSSILTVSEWKIIRGSSFKKILYAFTFPFYLMSFIPAAFVALFKKVEWKQTSHRGDGTFATNGERNTK